MSTEDVRTLSDTVRTFDESTLVLGIETSCDETAAALVLGGYDVVSSVVSLAAFALALRHQLRIGAEPTSGSVMDAIAEARFEG